ncbi:MAG: lipoprotein signal peptidase, partial [Campylobacter concisus]|nr:lipoprotein signal peptidase [Campylobacter concisus]
FNFAVFNFADVMIDLCVVMILWQSFRKRRESGK